MNNEYGKVRDTAKEVAKKITAGYSPNKLSVANGAHPKSKSVLGAIFSGRAKNDSVKVSAPSKK